MLTVGIHGVPDPKEENRSHDHGIAFMRDGKVIAHMELERFNRIKHAGNLPCMIDQLIHSVWNGKEKIRFVLVNSFLGSDFVSDCLTIKTPGDFSLYNQITQSDGVFISSGKHVEAQFYTIAHEIAHIATCLPFIGNFENKSLLVHIDGGAWVSNTSVWYWDGDKLRLIDFGWENETKVAVKNFNANLLSACILGLELTDHLSMPGKLMGLASYGRSNPKLLSILMEHNWFQEWDAGTNALETLLSEKLQQKMKLMTTDSMSQDIAHCMQKHFESSVLKHIQRYQVETEAKCLYYSGGAALNIHANTRIENNSGFKSIFIPPAPNDSGLALGAAAFLEWCLNKPIQECGAYLNGFQIIEAPLYDTIQLREVAEKIADKEVVATCFGNGEIGPRALGHRSCLARPDDIRLRIKLSEKMKKREWYRPVAPLMSEEIAKKALVNYQPESPLGRFMLGAWKVKPEWQYYFSGVIHIDGTVRAQIVDVSNTELKPIYELLNILDHEYDIKGCINTSFNSKGLPIVQTSEDADIESNKLGVQYLWV